MKRSAAVVLVTATALLGTASIASAATYTLQAPSTVGVLSGAAEVQNNTPTASLTGSPSYLIITSTPGNFSCDLTPSLNSTCVMTGLSNGTSYTFVESAPASDTTDLASSASAAYIPGPALATPLLQNVGGAGTKVQVWFTADGQATTYTVNAYAHNTTTPVVATCSVANTTTPPSGTQGCTLTGLTTATAYDVTVTPSTDSLGTVKSAAATITTGAGLAAPTATVAGSQTVNVSFVADGVATVYTVNAYAHGTVTPLVSSCTVSAASALQGTQNCNVPNLTNGSNYDFYVVPSGNSDATTQSAVATLAASGALSTPTIKAAGAGAITVSFLADGKAYGYTVTAVDTTDADPSGTCQVINTVTAPTSTVSCTITGLDQGEVYSVTVNVAAGYAGTSTSTVSAAATATITSAMPGAVTVPTTTSTTATVQWTGDGVATTYVVNAYTGTGYTTSAGRSCTLVVPANTAGTLSCTVTGLTTGTSYEFNVTPSGNSDTYVTSANSAAVTIGNQLAAPTIKQATPTSLSVSFTADGIAEGYLVTATATGGTTGTCQVINTATPPTNTQTCTVTGLTTGKAYSAVVSVINAYANNDTAGTSNASNSVTLSTALATPTVANAGSGSIVVTFVADGVATFYTVSSASTAAGAAQSTCTVANTTTPPTGTQNCTVTGLTNGDAYTFTVTPTGGGTISTVSAASASITVGTTPLAQPTVAWAADGSIAVTFTADGVASTYTVQSSSTTANALESTCTVANSTTAPTGKQTCTVSGLTDGDTYTFTVTPSGNGTTSLVSPASVAILVSASSTPTAPNSVTATSTATASGASVIVTWAAPTSTNGSAITGYVVTATAGNATFTCGTVAGTATTCTISGLAFSTGYAISVMATNANGNGPASTASVTTAAKPVPPFAVRRVLGTARAGHTVIMKIVGSGFFGRPVVTSSARGTKVLVVGASSTVLTLRVTVAAGTHAGTYTFTVYLANGKAARGHYVSR